MSYVFAIILQLYTVAQRIQQGQGAVSPLTQAVQQQGISVTSSLDGNGTSPSHQSISQFHLYHSLLFIVDACDLLSLLSNKDSQLKIIVPLQITKVTMHTVAQRIQQGQGAVSPLTQAVQQQGISVTSSLDGNGTSPSHQSNTISNTEANVVDGINLEEIKEFAKAFKIRRLSLGLTQTQVGQALSATEGPSYSQSAICRFEKLDITPKSAQKIKPVLERWMKEAEERYKNGAHTLTEFIGSETTKKRKRRTSFTPSALESLNQFFDKNTHPSGAEMTELAEKLNYDREVVRVWFCNKRQALKNTIKKLKGGTL
ncbi:POU domain, class 6, transcription factor 1-like [Centruroides sculpturatus]|uniref:POU domain, class 6, transcription factor 1-like n=1 Tax=Centruroides sculpturatus TaxID=218467 RepID=UPI000C6DE037|nr:POU domain, class 6, transcription factor 1-like [Centruroides sculpturatus]